MLCLKRAKKKINFLTGKNHDYAPTLCGVNHDF